MHRKSCKCAVFIMKNEKNEKNYVKYTKKSNLINSITLYLDYF